MLTLVSIHGAAARVSPYALRRNEVKCLSFMRLQSVQVPQALALAQGQQASFPGLSNCSPGKILIIRTEKLGTNDHTHNRRGTDAGDDQRSDMCGMVKDGPHHRPKLRMPIKVTFVFLFIFKSRTRGMGMTTSAKSVTMLRPLPRSVASSTHSRSCIQTYCHSVFQLL